jgi:hypothetical protein
MKGYGESKCQRNMKVQLLMKGQLLIKWLWKMKGHTLPPSQCSKASAVMAHELTEGLLGFQYHLSCRSQNKGGIPEGVQFW